MNQKYFFPAGSLNIPNNANWAVNALASVEADDDNNALTVHAFDDSSEEGVGFEIYVPSGATNIIFHFLSRAKTAPGSAKAVVPKFYEREIADNGAITAWSAGYDLTKIDIPTNENYQHDSQTIALATLGLAADKYFQIELTRDPVDALDDLVGDWFLNLLRIEFS